MVSDPDSDSDVYYRRGGDVVNANKRKRSSSTSKEAAAAEDVLDEWSDQDQVCFDLMRFQ
jgi:hypothetical protein